jgi:hypothetical protein
MAESGGGSDSDVAPAHQHRKTDRSAPFQTVREVEKYMGSNLGLEDKLGTVSIRKWFVLQQYLSNNKEGSFPLWIHERGHWSAKPEGPSVHASRVGRSCIRYITYYHSQLLVPTTHAHAPHHPPFMVQVLAAEEGEGGWPASGGCSDSHNRNIEVQSLPESHYYSANAAV